MLINSCYSKPGISDHEIVVVSVSTKILKPTELHHKLYLWNWANIDEMRLKFASLDREFTEHHTIDMPVEDLWESLCSILKLHSSGQVCSLKNDKRHF